MIDPANHAVFLDASGLPALLKVTRPGATDEALQVQLGAEQCCEP